MTSVIPPRQFTWAYGVTTVPERKDVLLPQTLHSLCDAGFGDPHLFVDGCNDPSEYTEFGCMVSCRPKPAMSIVGNWVLGMWELYVRNPLAHRYAMFQDDIQAVGNLREYLEACPYPEPGYLNLMTHETNKKHTRNKPGWCLALQKGLGATGLVFDRDTLCAILRSDVLVWKPQAAKNVIAKKKIDGGIAEATNRLGYKEYVHNPSLLQHWGINSSVGNHGSRYLPPIESFPGQETDAMDFLQETK